MGESASNRVVIAGGSGFLGRNLAAHLASSGFSVVVLSRGEASALPDGVRGGDGTVGRWATGRASWTGRSGW